MICLQICFDFILLKYYDIFRFITHCYKQQFARRLNIRKMSTFSKFTKWNPPLKINKLNSTIFLTILSLSTLFWFSLSFDFTLFSTVTNLQHHHNYTITKTKSGHHFSLSHIFLFNWKINTEVFISFFLPKYLILY